MIKSQNLLNLHDLTGGIEELEHLSHAFEFAGKGNLCKTINKVWWSPHYKIFYIGLVKP